MQRSVESRDGFKASAELSGAEVWGPGTSDGRVSGGRGGILVRGRPVGECISHWGDEAIRGSMSDSKVWGTLGQTDVFPTFGNKARGETAVT